MRANITDRDYEILSAYIDGQLASGEQHKLEERLRAREDLRVALDEMRRTRALLRQAPRRRAPRNFTLTPAMVGETKRRAAPSWNWFPVLSFTSALAALALVAIVVLQFMPGAAPQSTTAMLPPAAQTENAAPEMRAMEEAPQAPPAGEAGDTQLKTAEESPAEASEEAGAAMMAQPDAAEATGAAQEDAAPASGAPADGAPTAAAELFATDPVLEAPMPAAQPTPVSEEPPADVTAQEPELAAEEPSASEDAMKAAPSSEPAPPIIVWNGGAFGRGGGMGGGMDSGPITLPQESIEGLEAAPEAQMPAEEALEPEPTVEPTPAASPAVPAEPISGAGPILGVPSAGEGGQITERSALLGQPEAVTAFADPQAEAYGEQEAQPAAPEAGVSPEEQAPQPEMEPAAGEPAAVGEPAAAARDSASGGFLGLSNAALLVLQIGLGFLAIAAGAAAFLVRRRRQS